MGPQPEQDADCGAAEMGEYCDIADTDRLLHGCDDLQNHP